MFCEELSDGRSVAEKQGSRREQEVRVRGEVDLVDTAIYHLLQERSVEVEKFEFIFALSQYYLNRISSASLLFDRGRHHGSHFYELEF